MALPEVRSIREFRANLTDVVRSVQEPGAEPVVVGSHRRAEVVVVSAARYEQLIAAEAAAHRRADVDDALASVRAEGLEPGPEGLAALAGIAAGTLTPEQAREQILAHYRQ